MDVVYSLFSQRDDYEAFGRSIEALVCHGKNLGRLLVIGCVPEWLPAAVERFRVTPLMARGSKYENAMDGILRAVDDGALSGEWLYCPVECVLEEETDLDAYHDFCRNGKIRTVEELVVAGKGSAVVTRHKVVMSDTRKLLERFGLPTVDFGGGRFLTRMRSADAAAVKEMWLANPHGVFGYDVASLFGNVRMRNAPFSVSVPPKPKIPFDHSARNRS